MAGETPDASRIGKQRQQKKTGRRLTHLDEKKTDKYYASGQKSVINNSPSDSRGGVNAVPQANNVGFGPLDERSADKKYYKERQLPSQKPVARHLAKAMAAQQSPMQAQAVSQLMIRVGLDVNPVMDEVVRRLQNGETNVIVGVAQALVRRARTKLETLVTRELITEDQGRDVQFSKLVGELETPAVDLSQPPAIPTETVETESNESDVDIDSILSGETTLDDGPSTAPQDYLEDTVDDVDDVDDAPSPQLDKLLGDAELSAEETQELHDEEAAEAAADPLDPETEALAETAEEALSPEDSEGSSEDTDTDTDEDE